jgi:hypothetical protein
LLRPSFRSRSSAAYGIRDQKLEKEVFFLWDESEVRIWRSGREYLLVFGSHRASSAASAPARLGPGPCRQVSDSSSHEINSAWNLESATLPLLLFSYNENTPSIQSSQIKYWQSCVCIPHPPTSRKMIL